MTPDRRSPFHAGTAAKALSAVLTAALIVGAVVLSDAPVWVAVVVATAVAVLLAIRWWWDRRRG